MNRASDDARIALPDDCDASETLPHVDEAAAGVFGMIGLLGVVGLVAVAASDTHPADGPDVGAAAGALGIAVGLIALPPTILYALSARSGFRAAARCKQLQDALPDEEHARALERLTRARSMQLEAYRSALAGNCEVVKQLSVEVEALDAEFHAQVFARDAAIARCLSAPTPSP